MMFRLTIVALLVGAVALAQADGGGYIADPGETDDGVSTTKVKTSKTKFIYFSGKRLLRRVHSGQE